MYIFLLHTAFSEYRCSIKGQQSWNQDKPSRILQNRREILPPPSVSKTETGGTDRFRSAPCPAQQTRARTAGSPETYRGVPAGESGLGSLKIRTFFPPESARRVKIPTARNSSLPHARVRSASIQETDSGMYGCGFLPAVCRHTPETIRPASYATAARILSWTGTDRDYENCPENQIP